MKNQSEEIGALQSAKIIPPIKELSRGGQRNSQKKQQSLSQGRKVPLKENTTTMKKNLAKCLKMPKQNPKKAE